MTKWIVNPSDGRWRVRIDGQDVAEVLLEDGQAGPFRDHVAEVSSARVSLGLAMNMEGTLVTVVDDEPGHDCGEPGRPVDVARCGDCWDYMDERHALRT